MSKIIDGVEVALELRHRLKVLCDRLILEHDKAPGLAVVQVGKHAPSDLYIDKKRQGAAVLGFRFWHHHLPEDASEEEVQDLIRQLNQDTRVDGIILQLPLPPHLSPALLLATISPHKDVDGLHPYNAGLLEQGVESGLVSCTPLGCLMLLRHVHENLKGLDAVVIGKSILVGRPMASLLLNQDMTVTVTHKMTRNLKDFCRRADVLVVAAGAPGLVRGDWVKPGATVIDVGINRLADGTIVGDVAFDEVAPVAGAITPVPGGVGPMTVACLLHNTVKAAYLSQGLPFHP